MRTLPTEDGVIGMDGKEILGERAERLIALYDMEERFSEGLGRVEKEGGSGFIDPFGEWVIEPFGPFCRDFAGGFAASRVGEKWGFIDRTGKPVILAEWDEVSDFFEGVAGVKRGELWGLINQDGKLITDPIWDEVRQFREGFAAVKRGDLWGFLDRAGKIVAQPKWKRVGDFWEGFASVQIEPSAEQLAMVSERRLGNVVFLSFIDQNGKPTFGGQSWPYEEYRSRTKGFPEFRDGYCWVNSLKESPRNSRGYLSYVWIDTLGRQEFVIPKVLATDLAVQEEPRDGLYSCLLYTSPSPRD